MKTEDVSRREFICRAAAALASAGLLAERNALADTFHRDRIPAMVKPTRQQLAWQQSEMTMFIHFGVNTFTDREWGEGTEDPRIFNPTQLDAGQWVQTAKEAGFRYVILTAKHHDGFCLWQSRHTEHSVKNSPWKNGKGDVVREFANACHAAKLKVGIYLSPWDRHEPSYGDSPAYNRYYVNQLTELLTDYGEIAEVWLDGANGEGPNGKRQVYDFEAFRETIRKLQPDAVIFSPIEMTPDIRWIGNEDGIAGDPCWSTFDPAQFLALSQKEGWSPKVQAALESGYPDGTHWMPGESDVSIRPGWFWHAAENEKVKSLERLMNIYFQSVGRNSLLLLNVPPDTRGLFAAPDVQRLREFRRELDRIFRDNLAKRAKITASSTAGGARITHLVDDNLKTFWSPAEGDGTAAVEMEWSAPVTFNIAEAKEFIAEGQRVEAYRIERMEGGEWKTVVTGTTIGHRKLDRFEKVSASRVRWLFERCKALPMIQTLGIYSG
jgi:alpha-L-fucosidase